MPLNRFCRAISGNPHDAADLMNDTILAAFESLDKVKNVDAFKSYIFCIAANLNKMKFRKKKFRVEFNEKEHLHIADAGKNPEQLTDFGIIYNKILELPDKMSEALILFYISDLTIEDIQKLQGGTLSAVKQRLKRGREKLLERLETPEQVKIAVMLFTF
jgi:RNA polymerase sigma-70 factor (ECF subfamily)